MQRRDLLRQLALTAGGLSLPSLANAQKPSAPKRVLRVAHITDVHIQPLIGAAKGFERCLHHIQSLDIKPDLIINSGDCVMDAHKRTPHNADKQWKLFNEVLKSENNLPVISCVGNHDICCEEERAERAFCLQDVFPGYTNRVFAHWYSSVDWCRPISPDEENESSSEETEGVRILSFRRGIVTSDSCGRVKRPEPQPAIS